VAAYLNDPLILSLVGTNANTVALSMVNTADGVTVPVYDAAAGGWQPGFGGTIGAGGSGGVLVRVTTIPTTLALGLWTVTVTATAYGGATGGGSWSFWLLVFSVDEGDQSTLNSVDLVFSWPPKRIDPEDPDDAINLDNYTVTGPVSPLAERLLQSAVYIGDNTIRLYFDGPLVPGEIYAIAIANVQAEGGGVLTPDPTTISFEAFGALRQPVPLVSQPTELYDIRNPQTAADAPQGAALGTFVIDDDGDLGVETRRRYLRKRIFRRLLTRKGSIVLEPDYGLAYDAKAPLKPAVLRRLQQDAESQLRQEQGVTGARVAVRQNPVEPGIVEMTVKVFDQFGDFTTNVTIGGDE
jgi:hypothetical protein